MANVRDMTQATPAEIIADLKALFDDIWYKKDYYPRFHYDVAIVSPHYTKPTQYTKIVQQKFTEAFPILLEKASGEELASFLSLLFKAELYQLGADLVVKDKIDINLALKQCDKYGDYHGVNMPFIKNIYHYLLSKGATLVNGTLIKLLMRELNHLCYRIKEELEKYEDLTPEAIQECYQEFFEGYKVIFAENKTNQVLLEREMVVSIYRHDDSFKELLPIVEAGLVSKEFSQFFAFIRDDSLDNYARRQTILNAIVAFPQYVNVIFGDNNISICSKDRDLNLDTFLYFSPETLSKAMHAAILYPKSSAMLSPHLSHLYSVNFYQESSSNETWSRVAKKFLKQLPEVKANKKFAEPAASSTDLITQPTSSKHLADASISDAEFQNANRMLIKFLSNKLAEGRVYPQLTELHSETERHFVLAQLLSHTSLEKMRYQGYKKGPKSLEQWKSRVAHSQLYLSGLSNTDESSALTDWLYDSELMKTHYKTAFNEYKNKVGNFLVANILAEYQYHLFLHAGLRCSQLDAKAVAEQKSEKEIFAIWLIAAKQIVENCALMTSIFTHLSENVARTFLTNLINVEHLAAQMQLWMTDRHLAAVKAEKIPANIYHEKTKIHFSDQYHKAGIFNPGDLGTVDGEDPIKEANKLFYWMVNTIAIMYTQHRQTVADIAKMKKENNAEKRDALSKTIFKHLPVKEYHGMMVAMIKYRLQSEILNSSEQDALVKQAQQHENEYKEYQAATIQRFWRNRTSELLKRSEVEQRNSNESCSLKI